MSVRPHSKKSATRIIWAAFGVIMLAAVFLRFWRLDSVPPGWRDDELINSLVISQHVLDGDLAVYYADASGHEALYHALNAVMLGIFGPGVPGIRWLSAVLGVASIGLTFLLGRQLFGSLTGLVAAAALAVSFWSLMYSRVGIRHILLPVLALAAFYFFMRGLEISSAGERRTKHWVDFLLAGLFMGLSFYSYFASRGVPLILLAFLVMFSLAAIMAVPLLVTLSRQPESEARVAELAVPLVEMRAGNLAPLQEHIVTTLSMFHGSGDGEWLYNIPDRPVFGPLGAFFFWAGVAVALAYALRPIYVAYVRWRGSGSQPPAEALEPSLASAFLLIWWLAGISPAFISVPPASLGHTILAQPAVYLIVALPIWWLERAMPFGRVWPAYLAAVLLVGSIAVRDLPDYFQEWPQRGMARFLYRADIHDVAEYLNTQREPRDFAISGLLAGPWDRVALSIDLDEGGRADFSARWYDPQRAIMLSPQIAFAGFPLVESPYLEAQTAAGTDNVAGGYSLMAIDPDWAANTFESGEPVCFANGFCWQAARYDAGAGELHLAWSVDEPLQLPTIPLISNPPPPDVYAGPRLLVFAQLQDESGKFLVGDDGLWVDPQTLRAGDQFMQVHRLPARGEPGAVYAVFGLYDPLTNERILTEDGRDHIRLELEE